MAKLTISRSVSGIAIESFWLEERAGTRLAVCVHEGSLIQQNLLNAHAARRRLVAARATHSRGGPLEPRHLAHVGRPPLGLRLNRGFRLRR
jgi:hypothetical protein